MRRKSLNWKEAGRVVSVFLDLFRIIRDTFTRQGVGLEILEWVTGKGQKTFVEKFLEPLGEQFLTTQRRPEHVVCLATSPELPFDRAEVVKHEGWGTVKIELRSDDNLYLGGRKLIVCLYEIKNGKAIYELCVELESGEFKPVNSNVLDYLYNHPELFPEYCKKNKDEGVLYIYFMGSTFRELPNSSLIVRNLCWSDDGLSVGYSKFSND